MAKPSRYLVTVRSGTGECVLGRFRLLKDALAHVSELGEGLAGVSVYQLLPIHDPHGWVDAEMVDDALVRIAALDKEVGDA